jgi:hypothetical protein
MTQPDILCIGSVLWDIIGRSATSMRLGSDVPGRITRLPGGVAMNIAMTLRRFGLHPALLSAVGKAKNWSPPASAWGWSPIRSTGLPTCRLTATWPSKGRTA